MQAPGKAEDMWEESYLDELIKDLGLLENAEERRAFFEDLCTPAELRSMADRWRVARQLETGDSIGPSMKKLVLVRQL